MGNSSNLKAFFKGSVVLILSNIFLKAINFFLLPLYTVHLTPELLGISDSVTSFTGLVFAILVMGLDSAYSAFYFEKNDVKRSAKVFNSVGILLFLAGIIPVIACFFAKNLSFAILKSQNNYFVLILALVSISLNLWSLPFALEIRMQNRMTVYGIITVIASLCMVLLNIFFVSILQLGVYALVLSTAIVNFLQLLLFACCSHQCFNIGYVDTKLIKKMLYFAMPLVPSTVAMWILNLSDRYIILFFLGETEVGLYGIAGRFVTLINMVISAVSMAYTTFAYSNVENPDARKQYASVLNLMYVLLIGAAFIISMFSKEIIQIMATDAYSQAYKPMRDLMFAQVVYGISTITSYGIYFKKKSGYALISTLSAAAVNLILNYVLVPYFGISVAATTTLLGYLVMFFINYIYSQKFYPCDYGIKIIALNMIMMYLIVYIFSEYQLILKIILTILCAIFTLVMFRNRLKVVFLLKGRNGL